MRHPHIVVAVLLTLGLLSRLCPAQNDPDLSSVDYSIPDSVITNYLETYLFKFGYIGDKVISVIKIAGETTERDTTSIYLWTLTRAYSLKNGELVEGTAANIPIVLKAIIKPEGYRFISIKEPEGGDRFGESLQEMFPPDILKNIFKGLEGLRDQSIAKAKAYYHVK
jgi:hypothetical protein